MWMARDGIGVGAQWAFDRRNFGLVGMGCMYIGATNKGRGKSGHR